MKYSILIPSRNGMPYLKYAAQSVLDSDRSDFELVISINDSSDDSLDFLQSVKDSRLRVIQTKSPLSMSEHYDFILRQASGQWIQIIGDDDAIFPWYFDALDVITLKYPHAKMFTWERAYYNWKEKDDFSGNFVYHILIRRFERRLKTRINFLKVLLKTRSIFQMPQTYTGSVLSMGVIKELFAKSPEGIFLSIIPDVYSSVLLANLNYLAIHTGVPLTIVGTSKKSMSQGTRIYTEARNDSKVKSPIELKVPQDVHAIGLPSIFLIEVLQSVPKELDFLWKKKSIKYLCFAGVIFEIRRSKSLSSESIMKLMSYVEVMSTSENLHLQIIRFVSWVIDFSSKFSRISKIISNTYFRRFLKQQELIESYEYTHVQDILEFSRMSPLLTSKYYVSENIES